MRKIIFHTSFKRDYKRELKGRYSKLLDVKLNTVLKILIDDAILGAKYKDHALVGNWKNYRDCHIFPDLVLIYKITNIEIILARLGSHAKLNLS